MLILGVDIGGSGIKGAIVNTETGELVTARHRIDTPNPATPEAVAKILSQLVKHFNWSGSIGCGFPAAIQHGMVRTASNISASFIDTDIDKLFSETTKCTCYSLNDADAAGIAEMHFGVGENQSGVVLLITIGTGLGTVLFTNGVLLPNTELGHIYMANGMTGEQFASDAIRKSEDLSWKQWANRFNEYLLIMEALFWPDLIILGGGASKKFAKYSEHFKIKTPVKPATLLNQAGIIGAALYARSKCSQSDH